MKSPRGVFSLAQYGTAAEMHAHLSYIRWSISWLAAKNIHPNLGTVHGDGFTGKIERFDVVYEALSNRTYSDLKSIHIYYTNESKKSPVNNSIFSLDIFLSKKIIVVCIDGSYLDDPDEFILEWVPPHSSSLKPRYGIGYFRDRTLGPSMYAIGLSFGIDGYSDQEIAESTRISRWGHDGIPNAVFDRGFLRDIYPFNLLNESQISRRVGQSTLTDWIESQDGLGSLTTIGENLVLWRVPEESISIVSDELRANGLVY